jgi:Rrf2 family nitric oxide-sensitive transcriptional repressor
VQRHSDYALRILVALAATGKRMPVDEIASRNGIWRNHRAKVAQRLQRLGHIRAHLDRHTLADLMPQPARFRAMPGAE